MNIDINIIICILLMILFYFLTSTKNKFIGSSEFSNKHIIFISSIDEKITKGFSALSLSSVLTVAIL